MIANNDASQEDIIDNYRYKMYNIQRIINCNLFCFFYK